MTRKARSIKNAVEIKDKIVLPSSDAPTTEIQPIVGATNSILTAFDIFNPLNMQSSLNYGRKLITTLFRLNR